MKYHKTLILVLLAGLATGGVAALVNKHRTSGPSGDTVVTQTTPASHPTSNDSVASGAASDVKQNAGSASGSTLATSLSQPSGNYVSNHKPSLSSQPDEQSVCNTSPGATCRIEFSQNAVTKTLPAKTADKSGAVYWSWKLQDLGLSEGTWQITVKASLNDQIKTAQDPLALEVRL